MYYNDVVLGKGPALCYMNFHGGGTLAGVLPDKQMLEYAEKIFENAAIPYQREISPGIITENAFTLFENEGIPVCNFSIPTRYTHTPVECVSLDDLEMLIQAMKEFIKGLKEDIHFGKDGDYE